MNKINPTNKQIFDAVKFLRHWERKTAVFRDGYWFKMIGDTQVEVTNEEQNTTRLYDLPITPEKT